MMEVLHLVNFGRWEKFLFSALQRDIPMHAMERCEAHGRSLLLSSWLNNKTKYSASLRTWDR